MCLSMAVGRKPTTSCDWYIQDIQHKPCEHPVEEEQTKGTQFDSYFWITARIISLNNHQTGKDLSRTPSREYPTCFLQSQSLSEW